MDPSQPQIEPCVRSRLRGLLVSLCFAAKYVGYMHVGVCASVKMFGCCPVLFGLVSSDLIQRPRQVAFQSGLVSGRCVPLSSMGEKRRGRVESCPCSVWCGSKNDGATCCNEKTALGFIQGTSDHHGAYAMGTLFSGELKCREK